MELLGTGKSLSFSQLTVQIKDYKCSSVQPVLNTSSDDVDIQSVVFLIQESEMHRKKLEMP